MLSYALAIAVAISSLILFSTAFLMSKIHRKDDFLWSAVGLFYASILWFCARNITGTVLLGQAAATVLIISYCWQTLKLRKAMTQSAVQDAIANPDRAVKTNNFSVVRSLNGLFKRKKPKFESSPEPVVKPPAPKVTEQDIAIPETPASTSPQTPEASAATPTTAVKNEGVISDAQPPKEISELQNNVNDLERVTESQPLPNKLPEAQPQAQPETAIAPPIETQADNPKPQVAMENLEGKITEETVNKIPQDNVPQPEVEPTPEETTPEIAKPKSSLDSLETVEVAEVLEAEIDNSTNTRQSEPANIIEVSTTDINIAQETKKTDQNQANDSNL